MTLILLGHEISCTEVVSKIPIKYPVAEDRGLFAVADSALTVKSKSEQGRDVYRTLLTGLSKVHDLSICVMRPDVFRNGHFNGYCGELAYAGRALLAFAGNANSAHHALHKIRSNLASLRLSVRCSSHNGHQAGLTILGEGERNPMNERGLAFDEDTFHGPHVDALISAEMMISFACRSIEDAFSSVIEYCRNEDDLRSTLSTFAFGVWCPVSRAHKLYHLPPKRECVDGQWKIVVTPRLVPDNEVLALGTRCLIETLPIQETFDQALACSTSPAAALFKLIDEAIDKDHPAFVGFPINRPLARFHLRENEVKRVK